MSNSKNSNFYFGISEKKFMYALSIMEKMNLKIV